MKSAARCAAWCGAIAAAGAPAAAQSQVWIRQFGTPGVDQVTAVSRDGQGGVLAAGITAGHFAAPPGGAADAFLLRFDAAGIEDWRVQIDALSLDAAQALAPDGSAGAFIAGTSSAGIGADELAWLARYDSRGDESWFLSIALDDHTIPAALATDGAGGVHLAARSHGSQAERSWLFRYTGEGTSVWIREIGAGGHRARALAPDGVGGVFVAGETDLAMGGPLAGWFDAWVARYDADGERLWITQFGTDQYEAAAAVRPDGKGGALIAGETGGSLASPFAGGSADAWVARYTASGARLWIRQHGTVASDYARAVVPDGFGGAFVAGETGGSLGGPNAGTRDAWLLHCNSDSGDPWTVQIGTDQIDAAAAMIPAAHGVFVAGSTTGSLGAANLGGYDGWIASYARPCYPDCNDDGQLTVADMGCFQARYVAGMPYADCTGDGLRTVTDFGCFQTRFAESCP